MCACVLACISACVYVCCARMCVHEWMFEWWVCVWMYMHKCQYMHVKTHVYIHPHLPPCLTQGFFVLHHWLELTSWPESFRVSSCLRLIALVRSTRAYRHSLEHLALHGRWVSEVSLKHVPNRITCPTPVDILNVKEVRRDSWNSVRKKLSQNTKWHLFFSRQRQY